MNMLNTPITLKSIERILEKELKNVRILGDMNFTCDDYRVLSTKIKGLLKFQSNLGDFEEYKLCLAAFWVFALKYEDGNKNGIQNILKLVSRLPQYQLKYFLSLSMDAFHEYGIETFGKEDTSMEGIFSVMAVHAGMDEDFYDVLFRYFNDSINYASVTNLYKNIISKISSHMREIFKYIDEEMQNEMFYDCRSMFIDVRLKSMPKDEILQKYPSLSLKLIESCIEWCKMQDSALLEADIC